MFGILIGVFLCAEMLVRALGMIDFPLYTRDDAIGYLPKENQKGSFLNKNDWYINDKSMPVARDWNPAAAARNILLIGNSIVAGGNPYKYQDKLTSQIQARLGDKAAVWPLAVGGWTQINEIGYLNHHPEIAAQSDIFVWEYMAGGLSQMTNWRSEYAFPTQKPLCAAWYVVRRYLLPRFFPVPQDSVLPATGAITPEYVTRFDDEIGKLIGADKRSKSGVIWLYPKAEHLAVARHGREWLPERQDIQRIADKYGLQIVDIAAAPTWTREMYTTDGVHPTVEGNKVLAEILSAAIVGH